MKKKMTMHKIQENFRNDTEIESWMGGIRTSCILFEKSVVEVFFYFYIFEKVQDVQLETISTTMRCTSPMKLNGWSPKFRPPMD